MTSVTPVFTEYERRVVREIALHHVQPNAVQRVLEAIGKPVGRLFQIARESRNPALRGISDRVQGWVQEGLIKTVQAANRLTKPEDVMRRVEAMDIHVADLESMRYLPMSKLDHIADSFKTSNRLLLGAEGALLGSATTLGRRSWSATADSVVDPCRRHSFNDAARKTDMSARERLRFFAKTAGESAARHCSAFTAYGEF